MFQKVLSVLHSSSPIFVEVIPMHDYQSVLYSRLSPASDKIISPVFITHSDKTV